MQGTYYRWTKPNAEGCLLVADILGTETEIVANTANGSVTAVVPGGEMDADTARMIGVRLIEAAALADNGRSVREP